MDDFFSILESLFNLAGPWTVFAPTNEAFMNMPMVELEKLIQDPGRLSQLVLSHIINKLEFYI